jgi:D-sedoheptulose 7-phosphate isomerase
MAYVTPLAAAYDTAEDEEDFSRFYADHLCEVLKTLPHGRIADLAEALIDLRQREGTLYPIGNGGKASLCDEFANDLGPALGPERAVRVHSIVSNAAWLTAQSNDGLYEKALWNILDGLVDENDMVLAMSGSGTSKNVVNAINHARKAGIQTVGIGRPGGRLEGLVEIFLPIQAEDDGPTEDAMMAIIHILHNWLLRVPY